MEFLYVLSGLLVGLVVGAWVQSRTRTEVAEQDLGLLQAEYMDLARRYQACLEQRVRQEEAAVLAGAPELLEGDEARERTPKRLRENDNRTFWS